MRGIIDSIVSLHLSNQRPYRSHHPLPGLSLRLPELQLAIMGRQQNPSFLLSDLSDYWGISMFKSIYYHTYFKIQFDNIPYDQ